MSCDIGSHPVRKLHGGMNVPTKSHPKQDSCRASVSGTHGMGCSLGCNGCAQIKFSIPAEDNGSLSPSGDSDCLSRKAFEEHFHPAPDPIRASVGRAINPKKIKNGE